jgi:hypothetical protein
MLTALIFSITTSVFTPVHLVVPFTLTSDVPKMNVVPSFTSWTVLELAWKLLTSWTCLPVPSVWTIVKFALKSVTFPEFISRFQSPAIMYGSPVSFCAAAVVVFVLLALLVKLLVDPVVLFEVMFEEPKVGLPPVIVCERVLELLSGIVLFEELVLPDIPLEILPVELVEVAVFSAKS